MIERASAQGEDRIQEHWRCLKAALRQWVARTQTLSWMDHWGNLIDAARDWFVSTDSLGCVQVESLPHRLASGKLYVIGTGTHVRAMAMQCPCGCGESLQINLLTDAHPCWHVTRHSDGAVSLYPSVRNQSGCQSHFFVRRSRVYWWNRETGDARISTNSAAALLQRSAALSRRSPLSSAAPTLIERLPD